MINFDDEVVVRYKADLEANFPFFRMLIPDGTDAIINYFINNGRISVAELGDIYDGLYDGLLALVSRYPTKVAKSVDDKLKLGRRKKVELEFDCDALNTAVVFGVSQILIHLLTETSVILSFYKPNEP